VSSKAWRHVDTDVSDKTLHPEGEGTGNFTGSKNLEETA
jgi:hypothetical protein